MAHSSLTLALPLNARMGRREGDVIDGNKFYSMKTVCRSIWLNVKWRHLDFQNLATILRKNLFKPQASFGNICSWK